MDVFIEKAKVKKVLRRKEYQEVFFKSRLLNGSKSLKIYDCEKDIASLLKSLSGDAVRFLKFIG